MSHLINQVKSYIRQHHLINAGDSLIVGLSGGPDSVFLLHMLMQLRKELSLTLIAAHLNHGWRKDAEQDVQFCAELCDKLNVQFIHAHAQDIVITKKFNGSKEEHARLLRRQFFKECLERYNAHSIVLGHHADDQIETFFIRLLRGSSIAGLASMKPKDRLYVRPLLSLSKSEILEYLDNNVMKYQLDSTNESDEYLRNRIRKTVIPVLRLCDSRFDNNFMKTLEAIKQTHYFMEETAAVALKSISSEEKNSVQVKVSDFLALPDALQKQVLILLLNKAGVQYTPAQSFFNEIIRFIKSGKPNSIHQINTMLRLTKIDNDLIKLACC